MKQAIAIMVWCASLLVLSAFAEVADEVPVTGPAASLVHLVCKNYLV